MARGELPLKLRWKKAREYFMVEDKAVNVNQGVAIILILIGGGAEKLVERWCDWNQRDLIDKEEGNKLGAERLWFSGKLSTFLVFLFYTIPFPTVWSRYKAQEEEEEEEEEYVVLIAINFCSSNKNEV